MEKKKFSKIVPQIPAAVTNAVTKFVKKHKHQAYCLLIVAGLVTGPMPKIHGAEAVNAPRALYEEREQEKTQEQIIIEMRQELTELRKESNFSDEELQNLIGKSLEQVNPLLVGDNVVLSEKWLSYIGEVISEKNFQKFREEIDLMFECYAEFSGKLPWYGQKIFMEIETHIDNNNLAHSHPSHNQVCFLPSEAEQFLKTFEETGQNSFSVAHEIAHQFNHGNRFEVQPESNANFFVAYCLEHTDLSINDNYWEKQLKLDEPLKGDNFRKGIAKLSREKYETSKSERVDIWANSKSTYTRFDMYLYHLVDLLGWGAIKQAFQSYDSPENQNIIDKKNYVYWGNSEQAKASDLFDRIEYYAMQNDTGADVFSKLPDKGDFRNFLLNECQKMTPEEAKKYPTKIKLKFQHPIGLISVNIDLSSEPTYNSYWHDSVTESINKVLQAQIDKQYETLRECDIIYEGKRIQTIGELTEPNPGKTEFDIFILEKTKDIQK